MADAKKLPHAVQTALPVGGDGFVFGNVDFQPVKFF